MDETKPKLTWRDAWRVVRRWHVRFVLGASLFAIVVLVGARFWPLKYTGTAAFKRYVKPAIETRVSSFESIKPALEQEVTSPQAVMQASDALGKAQEFGFEWFQTGPKEEDRNMRPKDRAAEKRLRSLIEGINVVWPVKSTSMDWVYVSFTHNDPELAQEMPDALVHWYFNEMKEEMIGDLTESRDFLKARAEEVDRRLKTLLEKRAEFEGQHAGQLPNDPAVFDQQLRQTDADIDTVRRLHEVATQERDQLKTMQDMLKANPDEPSQVVKARNPKLDELKKELDASKDELKKLEDELDAHLILSHMTEKHPTVEALRKKIAKVKTEVEKVEKEIEETPEEAVLQRVFGKDSPAAQELAVALAGVQSRVDMASSEVQRLQNRQKELQGLLADYARVRNQHLEILRKLDEEEQEKAKWQERLAEVEMTLEAEKAVLRTRLEAVQVAEKHLLPSSPELSLVLGFALVGGLVAGGGLVFFCHTIDRSISTKQDAAKHFNLPVCGVIDEILTPGQRLKRKARQWGVEPLGALILVAIIGVASLNIVLWLRDPDGYDQLHEDPKTFIGSRATDYYQWAIQELKQFP